MIGIASFLESIIVPIPIEIVMIPYMLCGLICSGVSPPWLPSAACWGNIRHGLGDFFYDSIGRGLVELMGWQDDFLGVQTWFDAQGFWAILAIGVAPIPFQIAMLVAGVASYPLLLFILAATIARSIRYFGLAFLVYRYGDRALAIWEQTRLEAGIGVLVLIGGIVALNLYAFR